VDAPKLHQNSAKMNYEKRIGKKKEKCSRHVEPDASPDPHGERGGTVQGDPGRTLTYQKATRGGSGDGEKAHVKSETSRLRGKASHTERTET